MDDPEDNDWKARVGQALDTADRIGTDIFDRIKQGMTVLGVLAGVVLFVGWLLAAQKHKAADDPAAAAQLPPWHNLAAEAYVCTLDPSDALSSSDGGMADKLMNFGASLASAMGNVPPVYIETDPAASTVGVGTFTDRATFDRTRDVADYTSYDISEHADTVDPDTGKPFEADGTALKRHQVNSIDINGTTILARREEWYTYDYSGKEISSSGDATDYDHAKSTISLDKNAAVLTVVAEDLSKAKTVTVRYSHCMAPEAFHAARAAAKREASTPRPSESSATATSATDTSGSETSGSSSPLANTPN